MPNVCRDKFHGLIDKFTTLKDEILVEYEHEIDKLRSENCKLRMKNAETEKLRRQSISRDIPGSVPSTCFKMETEVVIAGNSGTVSVADKISNAPSSSPDVTDLSTIVPPLTSSGRPTHHSETSAAVFYESSAENYAGNSSISSSHHLMSPDEEKHAHELACRSKELNKLAEEFELAKYNGVRGIMMRRLSLNQAPTHNTMRHNVFHLISMPMFDAVIGAIITANAITIGIETSYGVKGQEPPPVVVALEICFFTVYGVELALRLYAVGIKRGFKSTWVKFDAFLVLSGLMDLAIKAIMLGQDTEVFDKLMLIRMLRLTRLARTVRLMIQFRTLWLLVQGLMHCLLTLFWTLVVICLLCYCFSILAMELIRSDPAYGPEYEEVVQRYYSNLGDAMLTHLQFLTLDGIGDIYRPLIKSRPELTVYVVAFIMLVSIALMNLVTAIMVESSLRQAKEDQVAQKAWEAAKKKALMPKLRLMFEEMDEDNSGGLDIQELRGASDEIKSQLQRICNMDDVEEIYKSLDYDDSGTVDIDEFCDGMLKSTTDKPGELIRIMKQCAEILHNTRQAMAILNTQYQDRRGLMGRREGNHLDHLQVLSASEASPKGKIDSPFMIPHSCHDL